MQEYHDRLTISTPEAVDVVLDLAGPGTRISSGAIDLVIQGLVALVGLLILGGLNDAIGDDWTIVLASILAFLLLFFYDVAWELLGDGRTPGKMMLGLRVVRDDGRRVDPGSSVLRNLLRIIELPLLYAPGIIMVTLTKRHQRLGDVVAGSLVVREPRRATRALGRTAGAPDPWEGGGPTLQLDTSALTDHDRSTARAFAARRETLDPKERLALATTIAAGLRSRLGVVPGRATDEDVILAVARGTSHDGGGLGAGWGPPDGRWASPEAGGLDTTGLTDHDRTTARQFAERRSSLAPGERDALATAIAGGLRARLRSTGGIEADEELVLAVARDAGAR
ncbi:RDD family protein [Patulibacter minatonensis]|uniref:RDD family protein n=1 Tax=Patulibacter minatonensis TaxID=298163 RepID=UPI000687F925|nr:RDD family protein [Patulibacter minatonensis]